MKTEDKHREERQAATTNRQSHANVNQRPLSAKEHYWKFYLGYHVYFADDATLDNWGTVPEEILRELTYPERRLIHYLASKQDHEGVCFVKSKGVFTPRYKALRLLAHKGIVQLVKNEGNIIHFRLPKHFARQQKFIIATCQYKLHFHHYANEKISLAEFLKHVREDLFGKHYHKQKHLPVPKFH